MKTLPLSRALSGALLAAALAAPGLPALAHSYVFTLGPAPGATHYFGVICSTDGGYETDHLYLQLQSLTPNAPALSAQVVKGSVATNTTDAIGADAAPSPASRTPGGNGLYQVLINKAGAGAVSFNVTVHCLDATGTQHTGTDGVVYQYQDR
ncbi:hypothetical protein [Aquabacterium sp.]|uniref:hypothetical protein n=1 Tax=Aquabacterium sp. TaxID=1872578 RepID=UPI0037839F75